MGKVKVEFVFGIIQTLSLLTLWYFLLSNQAVGLATAYLFSFIILSLIQGGYVFVSVSKLGRLTENELQ